MLPASCKPAARAGARYAYTFHGFGVTLRQNQRAYFYGKLDALFPGLKQKYVQAFGDRYSCLSPNDGKLMKIFTETCRAHGLQYEMNDIIALCRDPYRREQLGFF
ncbi:hypothetical protein FACS1894211_04590 [Clostridia bacterium]|nr:hypothetical protein FACS1894211_04590 [Clostridia bacterium]